MSRYQHKIIVEHIWRLLRASFIITATALWVSIDGITGTEWTVFGLVFAAGITDQFKGFIENRLSSMLGWAKDFKDWE